MSHIFLKMEEFMKKLKNLTFACLLILGLAACADDDKSSNNPPSYDHY